MNKSVLGVVGCAAALFALTGCTPEARQDVGQAGENVGQATSKSVEGTKEAAGKAADATADAAKGAAEATKDAAANAANATEKAVAKTGEAVADAGKDAAHATQKAVAKTGEAVASVGDTLGLTPKVKNAILVDDSITSKDINVDTLADSKTVSLTGSVPTAAMKTKAEAAAKKVVADTKSGYKVDNKLTVGAPKM